MAPLPLHLHQHLFPYFSLLYFVIWFFAHVYIVGWTQFLSCPYDLIVFLVHRLKESILKWPKLFHLKEFSGMEQFPWQFSKISKEEGKQTNKQAQTFLCSSVIKPIHPATSPEGVCFQQLPSFKLFKGRKQVKGVRKSTSQSSRKFFWLFFQDHSQEKAAPLCQWPWPEGTSARTWLPVAMWRSPGQCLSRLHVQEMSSPKKHRDWKLMGKCSKSSEAWDNILHRNKKRFWKTTVCNYIRWSF